MEALGPENVISNDAVWPASSTMMSPTDAAGVSSSSMIDASLLGSAMVALVGEEMVKKSASSVSSSMSSRMSRATTWEVSPGAKVSVPDVAV